MRVDKFLKISRIIKQRSKAKELCIAGKVKINGAMAKPSTSVNVGDRIDLVRGYKHLTMTVLLLPTRNVSKTEAPKLVEIQEEIIIDE